MENKLPVIGQAVTDHSADALVDNKFKKVKISDYAGKWLVLFFYPADFTFVCPTELEELADNYDEFKKLEAGHYSVIFGFNESPSKV